ncbi:hypothetical protein [Bacteroidetes bacterium endosymbiont of Geopemphigus sp.]|nr:hypothetical protein [Bacteroidetes bacterium endosymbiont of Geopemphigus sp.]
MLDIVSTDEIDDDLPDDALQCNFYQVRFFVEDFPIKEKAIEDLIGKTIEIPRGTEEIIDEEDEVETLYYSVLSAGNGDFETNNNRLFLKRDLEDNIILKWEGECEDFTEQSDKNLRFTITYKFSPEL